jgi:hypothetical protein
VSIDALSWQLAFASVIVTRARPLPAPEQGRKDPSVDALGGAAHDGPDQGAPAMATLPGLPDPDEPEPNTLPVEPEFAPQLPDVPATPEHERVPEPGD